MLRFLGVGSAFNPESGNTSAYFIKDDTLYLIDCGELIFKELLKRFDFNQIKKVEIFITHTHSDHVGSLGTLISYLYSYYNIRSNIYHAGVEIKGFLDRVGISEEYYSELKIQKVKLKDFTLSWIETSHSEKITSFGLLIETKDEKIYYSGDSNTIPHEIYQDFINGEIRYIYQDLSLDSENASHLSLHKLAELIPIEKRDRVIAMHLEKNSTDKIQELGFRVAQREELKELK